MILAKRVIPNASTKRIAARSKEQAVSLAEIGKQRRRIGPCFSRMFLLHQLEIVVQHGTTSESQIPDNNILDSRERTKRSTPI